MKQNILLLLLVLGLSGCVHIRNVALNATPLSATEATVIVFHELGYRDTFEVFLDRKSVGRVSSEKPLKFTVSPGVHELHTEVNAAIDRVGQYSFEAGQVYYMRIWLDMGVFVNSIRIGPTDARKSYIVRGP
ncbi:MAG: DUF2846 domain-containing protein [Proteobacteria bacterium]|nr:DUF2846 domain-containing protein [Pseudomonadota bacterium]MBU1639333.1 DUF2846 domain-containing protein [Pseudomonadota bacterium]